MKPEPMVNEAAALVISPKMARALADTRRSRILMELSVRPLSPSQYVELVGGGQASRRELTEISRCFRQLAEWGYIEIINTRTGGNRRGGIEHVYRRIQRALFDTSVWEGLPRAYRDECSGSTLESYIARIGEAVAAGTFDDEIDRHLSWDIVALDRIAWEALGSRLDEVLYWLPNLAVEAAGRMAESREESIPTTVGLSAFRAPAVPGSQPPRLSESAEPPAATPFVISAKTAKAVASKWRSRILMELRMRPMSPTQFARDLGEGVGGGRRNITRCFSQLAEWGFIEIAEIRTGGRLRSAEEKIYCLKQPAHFDTATWEKLPRFLREECSGSFLNFYFARINEAIEAGTFDAEIDRHLSWDAVALDRLAWKQLSTAADDVLAWLPELDDEAAERMAESGEEPIPTTVGLTVFRSPKSSEIVLGAKETARKARTTSNVPWPPPASQSGTKAPFRNYRSA